MRAWACFCALLSSCYHNVPPPLSPTQNPVWNPDCVSSAMSFKFQRLVLLCPGNTTDLPPGYLLPLHVPPLALFPGTWEQGYVSTCSILCFLKFKYLVAKQHPTKYVKPYKCTHDFVLWCNVVLQRRWASGVSVVTTGATWVRESGKSGHLGPSSKESKCCLRWGRDGMEWWWNGRTSSFGNTVLRKSTHSNFWLDFCTR